MARKRPHIVHFRFPVPDWPAAAHTLRRDVHRFLAEESMRGGFAPRTNSWMHHAAEFSARCGERGFLGLTLPAVSFARGGGGLWPFLVDPDHEARAA